MDIAFKLLNIVQPCQSFRVAKVCLIWGQILEFPNITFSNNQVDKVFHWILQALQSNEGLIFNDVLNCIASAVRLKDVKQCKVS